MNIVSRSLFGFEFYNRKRLKDEILNFELTNVYCDDIGLYVVGEYPRLEFNFVSLSQQKEWFKLAYETFALTILNLLINENIKIHRFEDEKSYFKIHSLVSNGYYIKTLKPLDKDDIFSQILYNNIQKTNKQKGNKTSLFYIIFNVINDYLGQHNEYNRPEKKFVIENIKKYSKKYKWLEIASTNKMLGLYKQHKVDIEEIYIPRIKMQHSELKDEHLRLIKNNIRYKAFNKSLKEILKNDFERRYPSHDDTDID